MSQEMSRCHEKLCSCVPVLGAQPPCSLLPLGKHSRLLGQELQNLSCHCGQKKEEL